MTEDQCLGCLLGLARGDAFGAPYEGRLPERLVWRLIGRTRQGERRWTDDTHMALDLAQWLIETDGADLDNLARRFAASYRWSRGYGPGAARLLKRIARREDWRVANRAIYPDGSFGNGAAMRAPVVGLFYLEERDKVMEAACLSAKITHAHPLGVEGAVLLAFATSLVLQGHGPLEVLQGADAFCESPDFTQRLEIATNWLSRNEAPSAREVNKRIGNEVSAMESCVNALYTAMRFRESPFEEMLDFVIRAGGDVDTIGAMAGAIWGAKQGASRLPVEWLNQLEQRSRIEETALALWRSIAKRRQQKTRNRSDPKHKMNNGE